MRKFITASALLIATTGAWAGGYLTNTNQSVAFLRNPARLATFDLDGAYSNPAGLAWLGEGWHFMFNAQNAAQTRDIYSTFGVAQHPLTGEPFYPYALNVNQLGQASKHFHGTASAPFIPSLDAAYQKGPWTVSLHFGITGGGGKATFNNGLPMFEAPVAMIPALLQQNGIPADAYSAEMYMQGRQYVYGIQAGLTYRILDNVGDCHIGLSAHIGARMNFASNHYEGYLRNISARIGGNMVPLNPYFTQQASEYENLSAQASQAAQQYTNMASTTTDPAQRAQYEALAQQYATSAQQAAKASQTFVEYANKAADIELDCDQKGWGIAPILGLDFRIGNLNIGTRYEFKTAMNIENQTKKNTTGVASFENGVNTPNDIPAILSVGAQYSITPKWRVMAGYNTYFDKQAGMAGNKQKTLSHNTHEITAGMEYDVVDRLTISAGYQNTDYGLSDDFQSDLSFNCDSYSIGGGLKMKVNDHWSVEAAYFWTNYKDYKKEVEKYNGLTLPGVTDEQKKNLPGTDIYKRTNKVFGLAVTYKF